MIHLRPIEISLLQIKDLITPDGELIELMIMPASKAFDGKERPILLSHNELRTAIEDYLRWVIELDFWSHLGKQYLGRDPNAPLIFFEISNNEPRGFGVQKRGAKNDGSQKLLPISMNKLLDELIRMPGLWKRGIRRTSFIKTYIVEAYRSGMTAGELTLLSGLSAETIGKYLTMDTEQLSPILEWWDDRDKRKQQRIKRLNRMRKNML